MFCSTEMYLLYIVEHIIQSNTPAAFTLEFQFIPRHAISKDKKSWSPYSIRMFVLHKLKGTSLDKLR